jgi:hypothetical protein
MMRIFGTCNCSWLTVDRIFAGDPARPLHRAVERVSVDTKRAGHRLPPEADEDQQELQAALRISMEPTAPSVGARVKLHSLQQKPEHNGVEGEVLEFDASAGRWKVQLHPDGLVLALKKRQVTSKSTRSCARPSSMASAASWSSPRILAVRGGASRSTATDGSLR